jgi:thiamine-phosphate pyrophosphorylase
VTIALPNITLVIDRRLYRAQAEGAPPLSLVEAAIDGGVTMLQLRLRPNGSAEDLAADAIAHRLREISAKRVPFLIASDIQLAERTHADGVLLVGAKSYRPTAAKEYLRARNGTIIGSFAASVADAARAERGGADFVQLGIERGRTFGMHDLLALIRKVKDAVHLPLIAFGGINTPERAAEAVAAGADGIAVTSAILEAADPRAAAEALSAAMSKFA